MCGCVHFRGGAGTGQRDLVGTRRPSLPVCLLQRHHDRAVRSHLLWSDGSSVRREQTTYVPEGKHLLDKGELKKGTPFLS